MKLSLFVLPFVALSLMACGQLSPSKKNPYKLLTGSSVITGACVKGTVQGATYYTPDWNELDAFSACPGGDANSVVMQYSSTTSTGFCAYPLNGSTPNLAAVQCQDVDFSTKQNNVRFNTAASSIVIILKQDQARYQSAMSFGGGTAGVPSNSFKVR